MTNCVSLYRYSRQPLTSWANEMADMLKKYLSGEDIYVSFDSTIHPWRKDSIGKLIIKNVQELLNPRFQRYYHSRTPIQLVEEIPANVNASNLLQRSIEAYVKWDGRSNRVDFHNCYGLNWIKDYDPNKGTNWVWKKPEKTKVIAKDKLSREIKVGDFISYILYHFDNANNAAGIYYGKVTQIDVDGVVWAKNIKLSNEDKVAEKQIKDNSLIVIMSDDLMSQLMMARLSSI